MTHRRDLERKRRSLGEIGEILESMKTLAFMETRKLARFLSAQRQVVESIEEAAADFLSFRPDLLPAARQGEPVLLAIGSERGFCGDFNRALVERIAVFRGSTPGRPRLVVVGRKLATLLEDDPDVAAFVEGPSVAEDVGRVLQQLIDEVRTLEGGIGDLRLAGLFHAGDEIRVRALLPPFGEAVSPTARHRTPPVLFVPPAEFLLDLVEHYLLAALSDMLYQSLMAENDRRVTHLDRAVRRIEDESGELARRARSLRQEEIVEEIEVILLSAAAVDGDPLY